jgi:hypothetical protein
VCRAAALTSASARPSSRHLRDVPSTARSLTPGRSANSPASTGDSKWMFTRRTARSRSSSTRSTVDQPTLTDDADPVGGLLHLAHHVRGHEDGATGRPGLPHHRDELLLQERVQSAGRLVQDEQLRLVHERLHDADLLPVPLGQGLDLPDRGPAPAGRRARRCGREALLRAGCRGTSAAPGRSAGRRPRSRRRGSRPAGGARRRRGGGASPSTSARPLVGRIRSSSSRIVVDLPAPFGPRKPKTSPVATLRSSPARHGGGRTSWSAPRC